MSDLSPRFAPSSVPATNPQPKRRPIPRAVTQAIELIATGQCRTITDAAKRIGWARPRLSKNLSRPECIEAMRARAAKEVALGAGRAAARLNELIESASAKVALEATKFSLQTAGIGPARDPSVNINMNMPRAGYVIMLDDGPRMTRSFDSGGRLIETPIDDNNVIDLRAEPIAGIGPGAKPAE